MILILRKSFLESAAKVLKQYPKAKSDIYDFLVYLEQNPGTGIPVPGFEGKVIKIRWPIKTERMGKSGGLRILYYYNGALIAPFFIFTKRDVEDAPKETIQRLIELIEKEQQQVS